MSHPLFQQRTGLITPSAGGFQPLFSKVIYLYSFVNPVGTTEEILGTTIWENGVVADNFPKLFGQNTTLFGIDDFVGNDGTTAQRAKHEFRGPDFCMECWIYTTATRTVNQMIVAMYKSTTNERNWQFKLLNSNHSTHPNRMKFSIYFNGSSSDEVSVYGPAGNMPLNQFNHIAIQRDGFAHRIYVNGVPGATATFGTLPSGAGGLAIRQGLDQDGNFTFRGNMAEFRTSEEAFYPPGGFAVPTAVWPRS